MKKAVVLLNMGGARSKKELKEFLKNMFLDKRIISSPLRYVVSALITLLRAGKVWENYKLIGGSKIYEHTQNLVKKIDILANGDYDIYFAMRYTKPKIADIFKDREYDEVLLFPMYPQFSSTTTLSSFDDAKIFFKDKKTKIFKVEHFFDDERFNKTIIEAVKRYGNSAAHLIFSAHSLPLSIAKRDAYEKHIKRHIEILSKELKDSGITFADIHLAYQSKLGPVKWLRPSFEEVLKTVAPSPAVVYPLSFTIDNSETDFELDMYYKNIANTLGITSYKLCKAQNASDKFALFIDQKSREILNIAR
ncbi:MAG: ferrochelatase [Campylobacteraceae bacterium]|nr:ferrochelatase [Campylobacteraceae bacterium]